MGLLDALRSFFAKDSTNSLSPAQIIRQAEQIEEEHKKLQKELADREARIAAQRQQEEELTRQVKMQGEMKLALEQQQAALALERRKQQEELEKLERALKAEQRRQEEKEEELKAEQKRQREQEETLRKQREELEFERKRQQKQQDRLAADQLKLEQEKQRIREEDAKKVADLFSSLSRREQEIIERETRFEQQEKARRDAQALKDKQEAEIKQKREEALRAEMAQFKARPFCDQDKYVKSLPSAKDRNSLTSMATTHMKYNIQKRIDPFAELRKNGLELTVIHHQNVNSNQVSTTIETISADNNCTLEKHILLKDDNDSSSQVLLFQTINGMDQPFKNLTGIVRVEKYQMNLTEGNDGFIISAKKDGESTNFASLTRPRVP